MKKTMKEQWEAMGNHEKATSTVFERAPLAVHAFRMWSSLEQKKELVAS